MLSLEPDLEVVGTADNGETAMDSQNPRHPPL